MTFANGENVGAYRIVEKLGQGGMATVYKAYHPALDRYVAIKVMHPAFMEDPNFLARFQREARIVAKLDHPNIIPIYDYAEHSGHPYLVMRFVEGETLKAWTRRGPMEKADVLRITRAVGDALTYAHGQGVLHRDIKPSNILITPKVNPAGDERPAIGNIYLTDFGLARMAEAGESTLSRDMMVGTPQYISPEQAKGIRNLDARTDIYSFGVVLYELLVGQAPFTADTPYAIVHDHIFTPLPLPRDLNPNLPESVERMLLKSLAKEASDRFQSVEELMEALETALEVPPEPEAKAKETIVVPPPSDVLPAEPVEKKEEPAKPKPAPKKKRRWPWLAAAAAAVLCVSAALCLFVGVPWWQQRKENRATPIPEAGTDAQQLVDEARAAEEAGDLERALELYEEAVTLDPSMTKAYTEASVILFRMGDTNRALDVLVRGVEANPDDTELHTITAGTALMLDRFDVAQPEVEWMQQEIPEQAVTQAFDGMLILQQGAPCAEARPPLDQALENNPDLTWAHYGMALCSIQEGDPETARQELEFVIENEKTPALLRIRAEKTLEELDTGGEEPPPEGGADAAIAQEFESLMTLASEIPDEELRGQFKDMLDQGYRSWNEGDREHAIEIARQADTWVQENKEGIGTVLARTLTFKLRRIIRLSGE